MDLGSMGLGTLTALFVYVIRDLGLMGFGVL